jgi:hypothetical protein
MSKRALVLLIGLLAISDFEALAVTPPLIVDPREDMIDQKPGRFEPQSKSIGPKIFEAQPKSLEQTPKSTNPSEVPLLTQPPMDPGVENTLSANPLWAIPLSRLTFTRERPLFSPTRRPRPLLAKAKPAPGPIAPPAKPAEAEKPSLSLVGTIAGAAADGIGLFVNTAEKTVVRLKTGDNHKGWILRAVRPRQVVLAKGLDSVVLDLPRPDMKAGGAPPAPPGGPTPSPPAPSMSSPISSAPPVVSTLPVNTATATGSMPMPAPGAATIVVQPPTTSRPPVPINPFPKGRIP